jgi:hypothetical protein
VLLEGTDLGIAVEHRGVVWLFFGDAGEFSLGPISYGRDYDPFAWTTDPPEPDGPRLHFPTVTYRPGLFLGFFKLAAFKRLAVRDIAPLDNFDVPTGGFTYGNRLYLFIARDGEWEDNDKRMQVSHLAVSSDENPAHGFDKLYDVSSRRADNTIEQFPAGGWLIHISPVVIHNADVPGLPSTTGDGVLLFGTSKYHASNMYLAWAPLTLGKHPPSPQTWKFCTTHPETPWLTLDEAEQQTALRKLQGIHESPIVPRTLLDLTPLATPFNDVTLGELSVTWSPQLQRWLLTYAGGLVRTAREPWGPWQRAVVMFHGKYAFFNADQITPPSTDPFDSGSYAPYQIARWLRFDHSIREAKLYYALSIVPPVYQVQLMRTTMRCP